MAQHARGLAPASEICTEWRVHHEIPNRTRFRLLCPVPRRTAAAAVERAVEALPGVHRAEFTVETGSLLVQHDGADVTRGELRRALAQLRIQDLPCAPGEQERCRVARNDVVKDAVLSLITAALPPAPRAALKLVRSLRATAVR
jgi:copper chaperone CopZ